MNILIMNRNPNHGNFGGDLVHAHALGEALTHNGFPCRLGTWDEESERLAPLADVIHIFNAQFRWAKAFALMAQRIEKKIVLQMIFNPEAKDGALDLEDQRWMLDAAHAIVVSGEIEYGVMRQYYGRGEWQKKVAVIPNGARSEFYWEGAKTDLQSVIAVGRIEARKNLENLAKGVRIAGMRLSMVGAIPTDTWVEERKFADKFMAMPWVRLTGFRTAGSLIGEYHAHNILAMPSRYETDGMTAYEGALAGCNLLLSTNTESSRTLARFKEVQPIDPDDIPATYADQLKRLAFANNGELREWVRENRTWEVLAKHYIAVYEGL